MDNDRRRTAIAAVALAATIVIIAAMFLTIRSVDTRDAKREAPPGTTGLANPRPPLDRASGDPARQ
jgi:hypothetical protein